MDMPILFALCFLVPFVFALLFKKTKFPILAFSYLGTCILMVVSPFVVGWINNYVNPLQQALKCDNNGMEFISMIVALLALIMQYVFNLIFNKSRKE